MKTFRFIAIFTALATTAPLLGCAAETMLDEGQDFEGLESEDEKSQVGEVNAPLVVVRCFGMIPTHFVTCGVPFMGTGAADVIQGTSCDDVINGGEGNDFICGAGGADTIHGDADNDTINGGRGDFDEIFGDNGNDTLNGNDGVDTLSGGIGDDTFDCGAGANVALVADGTVGNDVVDPSCETVQGMP